MKARRDMWRRTLLRCGLVAVVIGGVVATLLIISGRSGSLIRTVQSPVITHVLEEGRLTPRNEIQVAWARDMDRLARQAYLASRRFQRRGVVLLLVCLGASLICLQGAALLGGTLQDPRRYTASDKGRGMRRAVSMAAISCCVFVMGWHLWRLATVRSLAPSLGAELAAHTGKNGASPPSSPLESSLPPPLDDAVLARGWTQFRGPYGLGVAAATNVPLAWDVATGSGIRWKVTIEQPGFSSPVVWDGKVFLTTADKQERAVSAFDLASGVRLWRQVVAYGGGAVPLPEATDDTGYAAPTMACDGVRVFTLFGTGDLAAFTLAGAPVWRQHLGNAAIDYGHASSLLVAGGLLIVQGDRHEDGVVKALDPMTGDLRWALAREVGPSWSSPVAIPGDEVRLLLHAAHATSLHRLTDGTLLSLFDAVGGEIAPSPAWDAGRIIVAQEYARVVAFSSEVEDPTALWEFFDCLPSVASPVAWNGRIWVSDQGGGTACLDGATGALQWEHFFDEGCYASPIIAGGHLYLVDRTGNVQILETGSSFKLVATRPLGEACDATPAVGEGYLIFRTAKHLICVADD